jgi:hypothetical protein
MVAAALALFATTFVNAGPQELAARADAVVRGTVLSREARWSGDRQRIFTVVKVRVLERLKGAAGEAEVEVAVPGGSAGGYTQAVEGAPAFTDGEEVVLFLHRQGARLYGVERLALGKYSVVGDVASRSAGGARVVGERALDVLPLAELKRSVLRGAAR